MSLAIFILGGKAINNEFLRMLGVNETVFLAMIMCGGFLIVTASVGVSAAYSKNECLAFIVRIYLTLNYVKFGFLGMSIMLVFIALSTGLLIMKRKKI